MPRNLFPAIVKGALGFLLGLGLWAGFGGVYTDFIASSAQPLLRMMESPAVTRLVSDGTTIIVNREDFPRSSPRPQLPVADLTFNVILVMALFASEPDALSTRNVTGLAIACLILAVTHVIAFVFTVQSVYALQLGRWSTAHYGAFSRNFWSAGAHFYRIVGLYGIGFLLWWILRSAGEPVAVRAKTAGVKRARRRRR